MLGFDIFLVQHDDGVVAFLDVHIEPVTGNIGLANADACRQPAAMIAAGAIARDQGGHQAVGEAPLGLLVSLGHRRNNLAAGQGVALADVKSPAHAAPVGAARRGIDRMPLGAAPLHVDDRELPAARSVVALQQLDQHLLGNFLVGEQIERLGAPRLDRVMLRAKDADAGAGVSHILASGVGLAGDGGAAQARFGINSRDREGGGERVGDRLRRGVRLRVKQQRDRQGQCKDGGGDQFHRFSSYHGTIAGCFCCIAIYD